MTTASHLPISDDGYTLNCDIQRGPNWLFLRLRPIDPNSPPKSASLWAEELMAIADRHFVYRLVIELDELAAPPAGLIEALDSLHDKLDAHGGALRLCGMSADCESSLHQSHTASPSAPHWDPQNHATRRAAVRAE